MGVWIERQRLCVWGRHPLLLLGNRSSFKPDLDCSTAESVFGTKVRLPVKLISPTPPNAVQDAANLLHSLRHLTGTPSPVPPRPSVSESYLEETWLHHFTSFYDVIESTGHWSPLRRPLLDGLST
ncbi:unnamed protein product [Dibothriocephalus latus]|uniref:Uncharacterized protein n=1 Tax=Dibothriocephalus latus TaxID=60516 RepID=A0A3P7P3R3_DIBLA|nr:unnamed protein product [Dibothriocephalus latus]